MTTADRRPVETAVELAAYADLIANPHTKFVVVYRDCSRELAVAWARQHLASAQQVWVDPDNREAMAMRQNSYGQGYEVVVIYLDRRGQLGHLN